MCVGSYLTAAGGRPKRARCTQVAFSCDREGREAQSSLRMTYMPPQPLRLLQAQPTRGPRLSAPWPSPSISATQTFNLGGKLRGCLRGAVHEQVLSHSSHHRSRRKLSRGVGVIRQRPRDNCTAPECLDTVQQIALRFAPAQHVLRAACESQESGHCRSSALSIPLTCAWEPRRQRRRRPGSVASPCVLRLPRRM